MAKIINSYFPHDSNARSDRKILKLRRVHGWAGYGIYFALIEILREQPNFKYPLDQIPELEYELRESREIITSVITNFDLFNIDDERNFFSVSLVARLQPFLERSKRAIEANRIRWGNAKTALNQRKSIQMDNQMEIQMDSVSESKEKRREENRREESKNEQTHPSKKVSKKETHPLQIFIKENLPNVNKLKIQLTHEDCERLVKEFERGAIEEVLLAMENKADLVKKYRSVNLTLRNWLRRRETGTSKTVVSPDVMRDLTKGFTNDERRNFYDRYELKDGKYHKVI